MKKSKDFYERKRGKHVGLTVTLILIVCVFFLSVGYSAFSNTLTIEGVLVTVRPTASARITNVSISGTTNGGISNSEQFTADTLFGNISLPNQNSTVTFKVDVTVFLSTLMKLTSITGLPSNLEYSISGYTFNDALCNSNNDCNLGATDDIYITIGYASNGFDGTISHPICLNFNFDVLNIVARIGNTNYETLQAAINAVPTNNTETTVHLLKSASELITIASGKNVILNMNGVTLSNNGTRNVIVNNGTLKITNGTITSNTSQGAINNNTGAVLVMTGGTIRATGTRQAIYNDGGTVTISGSASLSNTSIERAAVQNLNGGVLNVLGGTIESANFAGIKNTSTMTIGTKDGTVSTTSPSIKGKPNGIDSSISYGFYDGVVKGTERTFSNEGRINDRETGYVVVHHGEVISNTPYDCATLGTSGYTVTFDANGGTIAYNSRFVEAGAAVGPFPSASLTGYMFDGWYDDPTAGNEVTHNTIINSNVTFYPHFVDPNAYAVAKIGNDYYQTLDAAIAAVPNNTPTTIDILKNINISERIDLVTRHHITFNLNNHTLTVTGADMPMFENKGGTIVIQNGTLLTSSPQAAVNNRSSNGSMTLNNLNITATGAKQAAYNEIGTMYITGNCVFTNTSTDRGAVHNTKGGTMYITGGTFISNNFHGIVNDQSSTLIVGTKDGNINTSTPTFRGKLYGINNSATFKFYDGIFKGISGGISGNVADTDGSITTGSEQIGSDVYITSYLQ